MKKSHPKPGRIYRTVGVSMSPKHVAWMNRLGKRLNLGPSRYVQALINHDMRRGGEVLAQAFAADTEDV